MEARHFPPPGESMVFHRSSSECACAPVRKSVYKSVTSGRGGVHQGSAIVRIEYRHNPMPKL